MPMVDGRMLELPRIDHAANQVLAWRAEGAPTPVLIHCYAGASRSAAVAYAVLRAEGMDDGEALRRVRLDAFSPRPWAIDAARLWVTHRPCE